MGAAEDVVRARVAAQDAATRGQEAAAAAALRRELDEYVQRMHTSVPRLIGLLRELGYPDGVLMTVSFPRIGFRGKRKWERREVAVWELFVIRHSAYSENVGYLTADGYIVQSTERGRGSAFSIEECVTEWPDHFRRTFLAGLADGLDRRIKEYTDQTEGRP